MEEEGDKIKSMEKESIEQISSGKWYLTYKHLSRLDGGLGGTLEQIEIPLDVVTEEEAKLVAKAKWAEIVKQAEAGWEKAKKSWTYPPERAFDVAPEPSFIYKIPLE